MAKQSKQPEVLATLDLTAQVTQAKELLEQITEEATQYVEQYKGLQIISVEDSDGYAAVKEAVGVLREKRVHVEKLRKKYKEPILEAGRRIDETAKTITSIIAPTEQDLKAKLNAVEEEKERIREEKRQKKLEEVLAIAGSIEHDWYVFHEIRYPVDVVKKMSFENLDDLKYLVAERKKKAEQDQKEEAARLEQERRAREEAEEARKKAEEVAKQLEEANRKMQEMQEQLEQAQRQKEEAAKAPEQPKEVETPKEPVQATNVAADTQEAKEEKKAPQSTPETRLVARLEVLLGSAAKTVRKTDLREVLNTYLKEKGE